MKAKSNPIDAATRTPIRRKGFTLIEVLVVITIIIVLALLAFTVSRRIRASAYKANALSSLRQVAAFNVLYSTENNGDINTMRYGDKYEGKPNWVKNTFWGRLQPYLLPDATASNMELKKMFDQRLDQLFSTPDADTMVNTALSGSKIYHDTSSGIATPLAFNVNLVKWGEFLKVSSVGDTSQILWAAYGYYMFNEEDGKAYVPRPLDRSKPTNSIYYLEDRSVLAAFLDGHIETLSAPIPARRFK